MGVVIRVIEVSDHVKSKINSKHGVTEDDVVEACERYTEAVWDEDPERGRRLLVKGTTRSGRVVRVVLYPDEPDRGTWRLGTAF
jgi:hypothetical protein